MTQKTQRSTQARPVMATESTVSEAELVALAKQASAGDLLAAWQAIVETMTWIAQGRRLPRECAIPLIRHLSTVIPGDITAKGYRKRLLAYWGRKSGPGRPRVALRPQDELVEALVLAEMRNKGHKDLSEERAASTGKTSSFAAAAEALGHKGESAQRVANRLRSSVNRAKRAAKATSPKG